MSTDISPQNNAAKNVEGVLDFNALQYECFPDLSVCVDRSFKESFFQKASYTGGQTAYCILNTGSDFVNGRTSYLTFDVSYTNATTQGQTSSFGRQGSAYNFVKTIRITDRAGNEIEYITDVNVLANMVRRFKNSDSWLNGQGSLAVAASGQDAIPRSGSTRYVLLLRNLCGLFDFDQLLPAQLCSGLRVQIVWEDNNRAVTLSQDYHSTEDVYTISNPRMVLDSHKLTDSVARQLNMRSANDGLEIQFRTWFTSTFNNTGKNLNIESRRAVSRAFSALCHIRSDPADAKEEGKAYSMAAEGNNVTQYQWRAGNLYFPQQPVKGDTAAAVGREQLLHLYTLYGKTETPLDNIAHTYGDQIGVAHATNPGGMGVIAVNLERSSVQDVSGLPLNNSRVLALNAVFDADRTREIKLFLHYLKIARVFMDNTELEE